MNDPEDDSEKIDEIPEVEKVKKELSSKAKKYLKETKDGPMYDALGYYNEHEREIVENEIKVRALKKAGDEYLQKLEREQRALDKASGKPQKKIESTPMLSPKSAAAAHNNLFLNKNEKDKNELDKPVSKINRTNLSAVFMQVHKNEQNQEISEMVEPNPIEKEAIYLAGSKVPNPVIKDASYFSAINVPNPIIKSASYFSAINVPKDKPKNTIANSSDTNEGSIPVINTANDSTNIGESSPNVNNLTSSKGEKAHNNKSLKSSAPEIEIPVKGTIATVTKLSKSIRENLDKSSNSRSFNANLIRTLKKHSFKSPSI